MSKYIDADKLIAEIERRRLSNRYIDTEGYENELLEIIASLQQEQQKCIYGRTLEERKRACKYCSAACNARIDQEQPEVDLDREIIKYKVPFTDESEYLNETTLDAIARHFAEWGATHLKR